MFMVVMAYCDDVFVDAEDYEVDEDGDLVFLVEGDDEVEEVDENGMVEVARFRAGRWDGVLHVEDEDEDEDEDEEAE